MLTHPHIHLLYGVGVYKIDGRSMLDNRYDKSTTIKAKFMLKEDITRITSTDFTFYMELKSLLSDEKKFIHASWQQLTVVLGHVSS